MPVLALAPAAVLVARMAGGDEAAFAELYDRYGGVAYGLALRVQRDPGLAEDATQESKERRHARTG